ncbi:MAG: hypothetical protein OXM03_06585 [Chloroflexota bacterium]|nr:hypothetical protein [Chloroflexota bacterium]
MADRKTTAIGIAGLIAIAILAVGALYFLYLLFRGAASFVDDSNPTILAAIIVGCFTIVGSAAVASYNARRAQERIAQEANLGRKAEVYEEFMEFLVDSLKSSKDSEEIASKDYGEFFFKFASKVTIYGGPNVVKAFAEWRESGDEGQGGKQKQLMLVEKFIREMRTDLGESNKGLADNEFLGLFVVGGKAKITEMLNRPEIR